MGYNPPSFISDFSYLYLFCIFLLVNVVKSLLILLIFSKEQILLALIFLYSSLLYSLLFPSSANFGFSLLFSFLSPVSLYILWFRQFPRAAVRVTTNRTCVKSITVARSSQNRSQGYLRTCLWFIQARSISVPPDAPQPWEDGWHCHCRRSSSPSESHTLVCLHPVLFCHVVSSMALGYGQSLG